MLIVFLIWFSLAIYSHGLIKSGEVESSHCYKCASFFCACLGGAKIK